MARVSSPRRAGGQPMKKTVAVVMALAALTAAVVGVWLAASRVRVGSASAPCARSSPGACSPTRIRPYRPEWRSGGSRLAAWQGLDR